jgi:hypothetical protein
MRSGIRKNIKDISFLLTLSYYIIYFLELSMVVVAKFDCLNVLIKEARISRKTEEQNMSISAKNS